MGSGLYVGLGGFESNGIVSSTQYSQYYTIQPNVMQSNAIRRLYVLDSRFFGLGAPLQRQELKTPALRLGLIVPVLLDALNVKLSGAVDALKQLVSDGMIKSVSTDVEDELFLIDAPTVLSAVISVATYAPVPCYGFGSDPSENHVKSGLWTSLLENAIKFHHGFDFTPIWELWHDILGEGIKGSVKSDFAVLCVNNLKKRRYPFLLMEFEVNGRAIHKDFAKTVAEAAYEMNRILSVAWNPSLEEVSALRMYIGLFNDAHVTFGTLRPVYNEKRTKLVYVYDQDLYDFDLQTGNVKENILNALNLVVFLRQVVCESGLRIHELLSRKPTTSLPGGSPMLKVLPSLPKRPEKSRISRSEITPRRKRVRHAPPKRTPPGRPEFE